VADPEVDAPMKRKALGVLVLAALAIGLLVLASWGTPGVRASPTAAVTGSVRGPTVLATQGKGTYTVNGSGGPAFASNGTEVGNVTVYFSVAAGNLSGVAITPAQLGIVFGRAGQTTLTVGATAEVVSIGVMISSVYQHQNQSINLTYTVNVVTPYIVAATIVAGASSTVLSFPVQVELDGSAVGTVTVPSLTPGGSYNLSFEYPTLGLSPGEHTFSISLASEHGLVSFANGATVYSTTFYVTGPAPNYTLWYVAGTVAFFGVLFIFMTRVAARRRGALRK
jgi:hypothetical protein